MSPTRSQADPNYRLTVPKSQNPGQLAKVINQRLDRANFGSRVRTANVVTKTYLGPNGNNVLKLKRMLGAKGFKATYESKGKTIKSRDEQF